MIRRVALLWIAALTALSCASPSDLGSAIVSGEASRYAGGVADTLPVGAIPDVTLHDPERNKDLRISIEYPARTGPYPLIVFSPGFGLTNRDYVGLSSYWASRGFVVIRASHNDIGSESAQSPADWRNRVRDVAYALDSIPTLVQRFPELEGRIDMAKIGAAGHGFGAHTAMLLGGARTFPGGVSYADARVKSVVAISPPGTSEWRGLTADSWKTLSVPTLFLTGGAGLGPEETETPEWRRDGFALAPAGDKWLIVLEGARHGTFTGRFDGMIDAAARERAMGDPLDPNSVNAPTRRGERITNAESRAYRQQDLFNLARGLALAFWDGYLREDAEGKKALEAAESRMGVVVEKK